jgi:hypothetical protein
MKTPELTRFYGLKCLEKVVDASVCVVFSIKMRRETLITDPVVLAAFSVGAVAKLTLDNPVAF